MREETPWAATLADMRAMADELATEGWETLSVVAGDTAAVAPEDGGDERFGIVHVIEGDDADRLRALVAEGTFDASEAYVAVSGGTEYVVTVCRDTGGRVAVLFAGAFEYGVASDCFAAARSAGAVYTHAQRLDGTPVATFEHEDPGLFDPSGTG